MKKHEAMAPRKEKPRLVEKSQYQRCLVLGGNGFVGSYLVNYLLNLGYKVRVLNRTNKPPLKPMPSRAEVIVKDVTSTDCLADVFNDCDICFHLISSVTPKSSNLDPVFDIQSNLVSTINLLNCIVKAKVKKVIFLSSGGTVYGLPQYLPMDERHPTNPLCSYGIIKLTIEKYLALYHQLYGLDYVILRVANLFGEWQRLEASQGVIPVFLAKALRKETINIWGDGTVVRDYIHVSDLVNAMVQSIDHSGSERVFNIGSGHGTSLNELLEQIKQMLGLPIQKTYVAGRSFDVPVNILSINNAKKHLNWEPKVSISLGLERMFQWLNNEHSRKGSV